MLFSIDETKYRIVDLSLAVAPPGTEGRPLLAERSQLPDRTFKHEITTHTHVGTHIESPAHLYEGGKHIEDFSLDHFYGRAILFEFAGINSQEIDGEKLEADIGSIIQPRDIVCFRNNHPDWRAALAKDRGSRPWLTPDGARWLVDHDVKLIIIEDFCGIALGEDLPSARENHTILFQPGKEILIAEFPDGIEQLSKKEFFLMALPIKFHKLDSVWTRAIAIEER